MARETISDDTHGVVYEFAPEMDPVRTVEPDTSLTFETRDSLNGAIQSDDDLLDQIPEEVNAATGPVAVEGADPGDVLRVEIEDVRLAEDRGRVVTTPGFGLMQDDEDVEAPFTRITPVEDGGNYDDGRPRVRFGERAIPADPCIGTIGVAPATESYTTLVPHDHGGNLDTNDVTAGSVLYLPVFQSGAMLAMGDSKAVMADGEMCGTGAEIATDVDVTLDVVFDPEFDLERPLIDTGDQWKTVASAETVEEAAKLAHKDAMKLLSKEHGYSLTEAHTFGSLVGGLEISQVVDPLVTVRNAIPDEHVSSPF
ncbi:MULTISPECIES: acetamidase/formamidase family protein [Halolamina]|uniref:Amidase n=1 Tax=Halolamina pelagica TaxID=699431 RepID=A0A1I5P3X3_9EURY|nr:MULTISPECIES: acetamidase/formamidase family protein [Halolamina]NHX36606.1 acetamidase [Halolamina sp. R1-12]SFP28540.1 amidase [Halolamina pelagica]